MFKRKKYIVSPFQYRLIAYHVLYVGIVLISLYGAGVFELVGTVGDASLSTAERADAARVLLYLHGRVLPIVLPLLAALLLHSMIVSNRIAGPLYRFCAVWRGIGEGDFVSDARIRKKDYLWREAGELNHMIERLNGLACRAQADGQALIEGLERLRESLRRDDLEEARELGDALVSRCSALEASLGTFRTTRPSVTLHQGNVAGSKAA